MYFTPTVPKCYASRPYDAQAGTLQRDGRDSCNIVFNAWPNGDNSGASLRYTLNGIDVGGCYLSGKAQHGATQGFDLANTGTIFSDTIENTLIIQNVSNSTIQVDHFKIYRIYKMCNPTLLYAELCPYCEGGTILCSGGHPSGTHGDFDSTRVDIPCNCYNRGSLSYSYYHDEHNAGSILTQGGGTLSWTFNFNNCSENWQGKSICLFNVNNVSATTTDTTPTHDIELALLLNGHTVNNYYLSRIEGEALAPSYDLAQSDYYNDTGTNTVTLENLGSVDVRVSPNPYGGIDVYRMYKSDTLCSSQCQSGQTECPTCECGCETCEGCYVCEACVACYECYVSCQEGCEVSCEVGCEVSCEVGCEVSCEVGCEVSCQVGCEVSCQPCQTTCESSCQVGCEVSCEICNTECEVSCQGGCQECEAGCQGCESCVTCQTACEVGCQSACQITCQDCQGTCQSGCQACEFCEEYGCELCEFCEQYECPVCQLNQ